MKLPLPVKILNVLGFLLFALFAWVQYNDIDPEIYDHPSSLDAAGWLLFYGFVAVLFLLLLFKAFPRWLLLIALVAGFIQIGRTLPGTWENFFGDRPFTMTQNSMSAADPRVELTREFFGGLIALAGIVVLWWERKKFARS